MPGPAYSLLTVAATLWSTTASFGDTLVTKTMVFAVELSAQNQVLTDPTFNATVKKTILDHLGEIELKYGDNAVLRAFGSPGGDLRPLPEWDVEIRFAYDRLGGRKEPSKLRPLLAGRITALIGTPSGQTDLLWSLNRLSEDLNCQTSETHVVLLANMVEAGTFADGEYRLAQLPAGSFEGCASITIAGFDGAFTSGSAAAQSAAEYGWSETLKSAGFLDVRFLR